MHEVTPWKVGADEKLLFRDRSLRIKLILGKLVLYERSLLGNSSL